MYIYMYKYTRMCAYAYISFLSPFYSLSYRLAFVDLSTHTHTRTYLRLTLNRYCPIGLIK